MDNFADDELKEIYIQKLKDSKKRKSQVKHLGKTTINPFGIKFKTERKKKNKVAKASRKANR